MRAHHRPLFSVDEQLEFRRADFALVAFAIFDAGYGPDNFTPFAAAFR